MAGRTEPTAALASARAGLLAIADEITNGDLRRRPREDDWSAIEVLAHLVDVDRHWLGEAQAIAADPAPVFAHFDDERWKREHADVRDLGAASVRADLDASHAEVIAALSAMSDEELARTGVHPRGHAYAVSDVFARYVAHDAAHTRQLQAIHEPIEPGTS